ATFAAGVELANARPEELVIFEGSGTAVPPVHADATVCVVSALGASDQELLLGYLGAYPLLLADLVVITLVEQPLADFGAVAALEDRIRGLVPGVPVVQSTFRPRPLGSISGNSVFFTTTAPAAVTGILAAHLESYGATVVGQSSSLANRPRLAADPDHERSMTQNPRDIVISDEEHALPYSKGLMASSIMATGLPPGRAFHVAERIEERLRQRGVPEITRAELAELAREVLVEEVGQRYADSFVKWQVVNRIDRPLIILIGGATGVGKSTVATQLAGRLGITRIIPTDAIREVMRSMFSEALMPTLHT